MTDNEPQELGPVEARLANGRLIFFCDRCGSVHVHGVEEGHRVSHCCSSAFQRFSRLSAGYEIYDSFQAPGRLTPGEASAIHSSLRQAQRVISEVRRFLELADVDPASRLAIALDRAIKEIQPAVSLGNNENHIEQLTTEDWPRTPNDTNRDMES